MTSVLRALALGVVLLLTNLISAQTDSVNLAIIAEINVTLDENCEALIIPEQVLSGDFDADGDGNLPFDAFSIVVEDADPTNGAIIDNCGTFTVVITAEGIGGFTTGWATVSAEDKTAPEFTDTPTAPAGPLYCDAVDGIDISTLPNSISRCYRVNTFNNTIVAGSLNPQLRARLLAGGGLPSVTDNCSEIVEVCVNDIVTRDPIAPLCNDVELTRTFIATDGSCGSVSGEENDPAVTSYEINFTRPGLDDLDTTNIPPVILIECTDLDAAGLEFGDLPDPRPQDLPFFDGPNGTTIPLRLGDGGSFCNIGLTYEDSRPIVTCELAYKVIRTYTIIDWCSPTDIRTLTQIVKIGDFTAPVFTAPTQDLDFDGIPDDGPLFFATNAGNECGAYLRLDLATASLTDACSSDLELRADIFPNGDTDGAPIGTFPVDLNNGTPEITGVIPAGNHILRYTYSDECGNVDFTDIDITIADGVQPTAICEDGLNISLTAGQSQNGTVSQGIAIITPAMIDKGSYDDCGDVTLAIGRVRLVNGAYQLINGASYGPTVEFTCEDLGEQLVGLRVTDAGGNVNYCWLTVLVEDKLNPTCTPPSPLTLTCNAFNAAGLPANIQEASDELLDATFGTAFGDDNCAVVVSQSISGDVNSCGVGNFTRTFTATDGQGFTNVQPCRQRIEVIGVHDYTLSFPGDAEAFCMMTPDIGDVEVINANCDLITKDLHIDTLETTVDECFKLRIEHRVINWCEFNTFGQPYIVPRDYDGDNDFLERTYLHIFPATTSPIAGEDAAILDNDAIRGNTGFTWPLDDGDDNDGTDDNNGADNNDDDAYATDNSRGSFIWYQFVKVYDEIAPQIVENNPTECFGADGPNCTGSVTLLFELTDECTTPDQVDSRIELDLNYVAINGFSRTRILQANEVSDNEEGDFTVNLDNIPVGNHAIRVRGSDGCGNVDVEIIEFCVTDDKAPTPICIGQLTVTLMPNGDGTGMAAMWATDFIASDVEDCSGEVTYSIYTEAEAQEANFNPVPGRDGIILNCDSDATVPVRVYAFDPAGRGDFCAVFVLVQAAANACDPGGDANIFGLITTETGAPIANVAVTIDTETEVLLETSSNSGAYGFEQLRLGTDYTLDADRDDYINHSQGVSTFDLVLITRFILGLSEDISPFQRIAADANDDGVISVQDIISIRRLILGLDNAYPNNTAYRFVDASFLFPVPGNPWATSFPEVVNINNLPGNVFDADFIGVMVGDVDGTGLDNLRSGNSRPRASARTLEVNDRELIAGNTYELEFTAASATGLTGLQGTLNFGEGVSVSRLLDDAPTQFSAAHLNAYQLERGQLAFSYHDAAGLTNELPVLRVEIIARENTRLSEVLSFNDDLVFTEGYTTTDLPVALALNFGNELTTAFERENELMQNVPNPVSEATLIPFRIQEAGTVQLEVRDLNGRLLAHMVQDAPAGNGRFALERKDLGSAGVLTYTLTAGDFSDTRKMIIR